MGMHTGDPCFTCGEKLKESDDVVVCPECGTPYHRACWQQNGACINLPLHESGESWKRAAEETEDAEQICPNCGKKNDKSAKYCIGCGAAIQEPLKNPSWQNTQRDTDAASSQQTFRERVRETAEQMGMRDAYCGMDQEESLDGERLGDVADFVERNTLYYLPRFHAFSRSGRRISLNFPCVLFPHLYFAYRKMWPLAMILIGIFGLMNLPQTAIALQTVLTDAMNSTASDNILTAMYQAYPDAQQMMQTILGKLETYEDVLYHTALICNYAELVIQILCCLLGNWLYFRYVIRRVRGIREENLPDSTRRDRLRMQGGTNVWLIVGMFALRYVFSFLLLMLLVLILQA